MTITSEEREKIKKEAIIENTSKAGKASAAKRGREGMRELQRLGQLSIQKRIETEFGGNREAYYKHINAGKRKS